MTVTHSTSRAERVFLGRWLAMSTIPAASYYLYVMSTAEAHLWSKGGRSFGIQLGGFVLASLLLGWGRRWAGLRLSDPGTLFLFWSVCYFLYPSGYWLQGGQTMDTVVDVAAPRVFVAHGVFMIAFLVAMVAIEGRRSWEPPKIDLDRLPTGKMLVIVPLGFLLSFAAARYLVSGTLFAENYGDRIFDASSGVAAAKVSGGLAYLSYQAISKTAFYPFLALGLGSGLALLRAIRAKRNRLILAAGLLFVVSLALLIGITTRSGALMVILIALLFADMLSNLVRWRYVLPVLGAVLAVFIFFGYFRNVSTYGLQEGTKLAYQSYTQAAETGVGPLAEFELMLIKEAFASEYFDKNSEGAGLIINSAMYIVPSQVLPGKLQWLETGDLLSRRLLSGNAYDRGGGVAGSTVADGFRFGGLPGVAVVAMLLGAILGAVARWATAPMRAGNNPELLRVALASGYLAWTFAFIRGSLAVVIALTVYNLVFPWVALRFLLPPGAEARWAEPMAKPPTS